MKWRAPGETKYGKGWILGTLSGEPAFSDGHAMFVGKRKGSQAKDPEMFEKVLTKIQVKTRRRLQPGRRERYMDWLPVIYLGDFRIDEKFYEHARKIKGVEFFAGKKGTAVICKVGKKVVGAIMAVK